METERRTLQLPDGRIIEYTVDRGMRNNIYIHIKNGKVVLKLPLWAEEDQGERFLREKADWVLKNIGKRSPEEVIPESFTEGTVFPFYGETLTVCCEYPEKYFPPFFAEGRIVAACPPGGYTDKDAYVDAQVRRAIRKRTLELVNDGFARLTALTGLYPKKVTVKKMSASWGRCSSTGNISINSKAVFFPPECLDYVIIHELCHLRYMDHSPEFWALVSRFCPDWKRIRASMRGM